MNLPIRNVNRVTLSDFIPLQHLIPMTILAHVYICMISESMPDIIHISHKPVTFTWAPTALTLKVDFCVMQQQEASTHK